MNPPATPAALLVERLNSPAFSALGLPFSEIVRMGDTLYLSGQMGTLPGTLTLAPGGMQAEARQAMQNIQSTLEAHGYALDHIVKCTVMLADMADWPAFNAIYTGFFTAPYPARSAFGCSGLAMGGRLEIDVIASVRR
ncbi:MAG: RidA family protein [Polaromonas sp.]|uniref:RidA family protein n=1 Tax=Polaromonas sp. TaxID=1869339 RepID=UPI00403557B4